MIDNISKSTKCDQYEKKDCHEIEEQNLYRKFIYTVCVGIALIFISHLIGKGTIDNGLSATGVICILYASIIYWNDLTEKFRLMLLGVTLLSLLVFAYEFEI